MFRKILTVGVALAVLALGAVVYSGATRQLDIAGTLYVPVDGLDSVTVVGEKHSLTTDNNYRSSGAPREWGLMIGEVYVSDFAETDSTIAGESVVDTAFVSVFTKFGNYTQTMLILDTMITLPGTLYIDYIANYTPDDTAVGSYTSGRTGNPLNTALLADQFWIQVKGVDTAGSSGSLRASVKYNFRFLELGK